MSADSFSYALPVVSSKEGGRGRELYDKFFVEFVFPLKPGILALNQVDALKQVPGPRTELGLNSGDELWG